MRKILKSTALKAIGLCTALACSVSLLAWQESKAQERIQPTLVESALDGKLDQQTIDSLGDLTPKPQSASASSSTAAKPAQASLSAASKKNKKEKAVEDPNKPVVRTVPPTRTMDDKIPEPVSIMDPPIHSTIQAGEKTFLKVPLGLKVGKANAIDTTYRGKPTLPSVSTVTFGTPSWAIPPKKKIAGLNSTVGAPPVNTAPITLSPASRQTPAASVQAPTTTAATTAATAIPAKTGEQAAPAVLNTVNFRFLTITDHMRPTDSIWVYPYPPKPPKQIIASPLAEAEGPLKAQLLNYGYSARPDPDRPYPNGGVRWQRAFQNARQKANAGYPHTMITMYPWVNKMFPYMQAETIEMNRIEEARSKRYEQIVDDYERIHADLESQATARGLVPLEVKVNPRGIGQIQLPNGTWWIAATRKMPGLKFYWQVPVSCSDGQTVNVQLNEANALICGGGW